MRKLNRKDIYEIIRMIEFYLKHRMDVSSALEFLVRYKKGTL